MRKALWFLTLTILMATIVPSIHYPQSLRPPTTINAGPIGGTDYPWTMLRDNQLRNGVTNASGPSTSNLMWSYTTSGLVYPSPIVDSGLVIIPSYDGTLYVIDEYTGTLRWSFKTGAPIFATPVVTNGTVYLASKDQVVYALDEQTGSCCRWQRANISPITSSPLIADGKLFYGTWFNNFNSQLLAIDPSSGLIVWSYAADDNIYSSPAVQNGRVFFGKGLANPATIIALNETTGTQIWSYNTGIRTTITTAPALAYGNVYIGLDSTEFLALNQATGSLLWTFPTPNGTNATSAAVNNGIVYLGTGRGIFYALNATTGGVLWRYPATTNIGPITSSPALSIGSNAIYFGSNDGNLYAIDMTTHLRMWRYLTGGQIYSSPAVADSRVFFGSKDGKVYAVGVIPSKLHDSISANPKVIESGQISILTITVSNATSPVAGANLTFTSTQGGAFSLPQDLGSGVYRANYTAPPVTTSVNSTIQVTASFNGYVSAINSTIIKLNPLPRLTVAVASRPSLVTPGGEISLMIKVTNGTALISGATLSFFSSVAGGSFNGVTDSGNGNYTATFTTPLQNSNPVVTIIASKVGFAPGQAQTTVAVNGIPNLTTLKVAGVPFFLLVAVTSIGVLLLAAVLVRRKKQPYHYTPPQPSFTY